MHATFFKKNQTRMLFFEMVVHASQTQASISSLCLVQLIVLMLNFCFYIHSIIHNREVTIYPTPSEVRYMP
jgi:hypothetical protein